MAQMTERKCEQCNEHHHIEDGKRICSYCERCNAYRPVRLRLETVVKQQEQEPVMRQPSPEAALAAMAKIGEIIEEEIRSEEEESTISIPSFIPPPREQVQEQKQEQLFQHQGKPQQCKQCNQWKYRCGYKLGPINVGSGKRGGARHGIVSFDCGVQDKNVHFYNKNNSAICITCELKNDAIRHARLRGVTAETRTQEGTTIGSIIRPESETLDELFKLNAVLAEAQEGLQRSVDNLAKSKGIDAVQNLAFSLDWFTKVVTASLAKHELNINRHVDQKIWRTWGKLDYITKKLGRI